MNFLNIFMNKEKFPVIITTLDGIIIMEVIYVRKGTPN